MQRRCTCACKQAFVSNSPKASTVWLYVGMIALSTLMTTATSALALYLMERGARMRIADAKHEESTRSHKWIIGYGEELHG